MRASPPATRERRLQAVAFWGSSLALSPLLLLQALYTALSTPRLPEATGGQSAPDTDAAQPLDLLVVGESTAVGVGVSTLEQALAGQLADRLYGPGPARWRVVGRNGARVSAMCSLLAATRVPPARLAIVLLGVNDTVKLTPLGRFQRDVAALVEALRRHGADRVLVPAVPPVGWFTALPRPLRWMLGWRARQLDAALRGVDAHFEHLALAFPPLPELLAEDGYHPSAEGYARWACLIAEALDRSPGPPPAPPARGPRAPPGDDRPARSAASARD